MSSKQAIAYHSITIGGKNTWDDWHLIPTSRPVFNPPSVKTNYVEVPGAQGVLDLTEASFGEVLYNNREGSLEFIVVNDTWPSWNIAKHTIINYLHGKEYTAILDDEPNYLYKGRFTLNEWRSNNNGTWSTIVIDYNLEPFKYTVDYAGDDWLWDPFHFVGENPTEKYPDGAGTKIETNEFKVIAKVGSEKYGSVTKTFDPGAAWQVPEFFSASGFDSEGNLIGKYYPDMRVVYAGKEYKIKTDGTYTRFPNIVLKSGANKLTFRNYGSIFGTLRVRYRVGVL